MLVAFGLEPTSLQPRLLQPRGLRSTPVPHPTARVQICQFLPRAPGALLSCLSLRFSISKMQRAYMLAGLL